MENNKVDSNREEFNDDMKWVRDSSFDYKGRVPLRASTGSWKASLFIIGKEEYLDTCFLYTNSFWFSILVYTNRRNLTSLWNISVWRKTRSLLTMIFDKNKDTLIYY